MRNGVSGAPLPVGFPYKTIIDLIGMSSNFSPCLIGAVKMNETGLGQGPTSEQDVSGDGGHGLMQLTSSWPSDWKDPQANISYAVEHFLIPAFNAWKGTLQGDDLVRAIAATYNAGLGNAEAGHAEGDVGKFTTNHYDQRCLVKYKALVGGTIP